MPPKYAYRPVKSSRAGHIFVLLKGTALSTIYRVRGVVALAMHVEDRV